MLMIVFDPGLRTWSRTFLDGMCVIEAKNAFAIFRMKRQRVFDPMRTLYRHCDPFHIEFDPQRAGLVHHERFTIEQKQ